MVWGEGGVGSKEDTELLSDGSACWNFKKQ